jgi:outer membrane cobalamin receptor
MRFALGACLLLFSLALAAPVHAQQPAMEGILPDSIVVTASRYADEARTTGRRLTVWTAQEIATLPVTSFDELLRTVGGVEAQSRGGFGVQSDLTMRGSTFNGVLVLLDGARLNDPMTGHFLADLPVPLSEIARIEVLRGPATALYGPDALGGVIQLFTYTGLYQRATRRTGTDATLHLRGGQHALYDVDAAARHFARSTLLSGATTWQGSDGEAIRSDDGTIVRGPDGPVRTDFTRQAHTAAVAHTLPSGASLYARAGYDDRDFSAYRFYTDFPSDTAREATSTLWAQVRLRPARWDVQVAARQHQDEYVYNPQTPANNHTSRLLSAHALRRWTPAHALRLTTGLAASVRGIDSNNLGLHSDGAGGAFALARWQATPRLTVNGSLRADADPGYGLEVTPHLYAAYTRSAWTLRGGLARAVRAPNYIERYFNTTLERPRGRSLGNPDLRAERAWTAEAGLDVFPHPALALHATAFHRTTTDLIDYAKLSPADTVWLARNILDVQTTGLELDAEATPRLGRQRLRLALSYAWLDADLGDVADGVQYKYALTNARHIVQANAAVTRGPVLLGLQALWKDRLTGASYGVIDVRVGYSLPLGRQRLALTAEVRNLFDTDYTEVFGAPMPGRWWLVGVRLSR